MQPKWLFEKGSKKWMWNSFPGRRAAPIGYKLPAKRLHGRGSHRSLLQHHRTPRKGKTPLDGGRILRRAILHREQFQLRLALGRKLLQQADVRHSDASLGDALKRTRRPNFRVRKVFVNLYLKRERAVLGFIATAILISVQLDATSLERYETRACFHIYPWKRFKRVFKFTLRRGPRSARNE